MVGFIATGESPTSLSTKLFALDRNDFWDFGGIFLPFGLLKGEKMINAFEQRLKRISNSISFLFIRRLS